MHHLTHIKLSSTLRCYPLNKQDIGNGMCILIVSVNKINKRKNFAPLELEINPQPPNEN